MENHIQIEDANATGTLPNHLEEISSPAFNIQPDESGILLVGIGLFCQVREVRVTGWGAMDMISCKITSLGTGDVIANFAINSHEMSPHPPVAPFDKELTENTGPLNLSTGRYLVELTANYMLLPNILGGYILMVPGFQIYKQGVLIQEEVFRPSRGDLMGTKSRSFTIDIT